MPNNINCDFLISADHPALAGHFPDYPVVPAALLLDHIMAQWQRLTPTHTETDAALSLQQLRCSQPVQVDQVIQLQCTQRDESSWRFSASQRGVVVCRGLIGREVPAAASSLGSPESALPLHSTADYYRRLPHAGSMCLIADIACLGADSVGAAVLQPDNPLLQQGYFSPWLALEYAAQVFACQGVHALGAFERAQIALVRRLAGHQPPMIAAGQCVTVQLRLLEQITQACTCVFEVSVDGALFASGEFTAVFG